MCGKKFTASSNLYYHRMTHIKVSINSSIYMQLLMSKKIMMWHIGCKNCNENIDYTEISTWSALHLAYICISTRLNDMMMGVSWSSRLARNLHLLFFSFFITFIILWTDMTTIDRVVMWWNDKRKRFFQKMLKLSCCWRGWNILIVSIKFA